MPVFSDPQLQFIAEVFSDIGQVFFASMVAPFFFAPALKPELILSGLVLSLAFWLLGLIIIKPIKICLS